MLGRAAFVGVGEIVKGEDYGIYFLKGTRKWHGQARPGDFRGFSRGQDALACGFLGQQERAMSPDKLAALTVREEAFVRRVFEGQELHLAYRACFRCAGLSEKNITSNAKLILAKPNVNIRLEQMLRDAAMISSIDKARVLQQMADIAFAKASDFIKISKYCCRYCHGFNNKYQWKDSEEFEEAVQLHARDMAIYEALPDLQRRTATKPKPPSDEGGYEYQQFLPPNRHCNECNGAGREELEYKDIDSIPKSSLPLFAGAKRTKFGVELILKDQGAHLRMLADALGLFTKKVEVTTPEGGLQVNHTMVPPQLASMPSEELETLQALLMKALQPSDNSVTDVVAKPAARDPSNVPMSDRGVEE